MTCAIPGMCSRSPECKDKRCEGHPINSLSLHRVYLNQSEGGCTVDTLDTPEQMQERTRAVAYSLAFFAAVIVAALFFGARLIAPFN